MAQFDVYPNPSKTTRQAYPYLVDVQNSIIEDLDTRLVVPLTPSVSKPNMLMAKLTPEVYIDGKAHLFLTPQMASVPKDILKQPIGTLAVSRSVLIDAIDFAVTGV